MIPGYGMGRVWAGSGREGGTEGRVGYCFLSGVALIDGVAGFFGGGVDGVSNGGFRVFPGWVPESGLGVVIPLGV